MDIKLKGKVYIGVWLGLFVGLHMISTAKTAISIGSILAPLVWIGISYMKSIKPTKGLLFSMPLQMASMLFLLSGFFFPMEKESALFVMLSCAFLLGITPALILHKAVKKNNLVKVEVEVEQKPQSKIATNDVNEKDPLKAELKKCTFIRDDMKETAYRALSGEIDLFKDKDLLSLEEKKALGMNARLKLTRDFVGILNMEGLSLKNPKESFFNITTKLTLNELLVSQIDDAKRLGIKKLKLLPAGDERDCSWCQGVKGKTFGTNDKIIKMIEDNCTCADYSRITIIPVVEA